VHNDDYKRALVGGALLATGLAILLALIMLVECTVKMVPV